MYISNVIFAFPYMLKAIKNQHDIDSGKNNNSSIMKISVFEIKLEVISELRLNFSQSHVPHL